MEMGMISPEKPKEIFENKKVAPIKILPSDDEVTDKGDGPIIEIEVE